MGTERVAARSLPTPPHPVKRVPFPHVTCLSAGPHILSTRDLGDKLAPLLGAIRQRGRREQRFHGLLLREVVGAQEHEGGVEAADLGTL